MRRSGLEWFVTDPKNPDSEEVLIELSEGKILARKSGNPRVIFRCNVCVFMVIYVLVILGKEMNKK
jgi:hypothetical protein